MSFKFNPLWASGFSLSGSSSNPNFTNPVATEGDLPTSPTPNDGALIVVQSTDHVYVYDGTTSKWVDTGITEAAFGSTPNTSGYDLNVNTSGGIIRNEIVIQPADATHPGAVSTTTQTLAGAKTFADAATMQSSLTVTGVTYADGGTDVTTPLATLSIGTGNAGVVNIGNPSATVNIQGSVNNVTTTNLNVTDALITINDGGGAGSGAGSGFEIEEAGSPTGYFKSSGDRNSFVLKAPNTAGVATITPGGSGITLDQSSHDPFTLTTLGSSPNTSGATLSTQQLTLQPADGTNPGLITAGAQTIGGVKTFSSSPVVTPLTASQVVVTDAGKALASVAYSSSNTASAIVQRDSSGNFSAGTITASVTGAASLNLLKAGDTMTGPLVMPSSGTAAATSVNWGTAGTGLYGTSTVTAFSSGGSEIARVTPSGISIGDTATKTAGLYVKQPTGSDHGILLGATDNANLVSFDREGNVFYLGRSGTNYVMGITTGGSFIDWVGFTPGAGIGVSATTPGYPFNVDYASGTNTFSALSDITINKTTQTLPLISVRNRNSTAGRMAGYLTVGSSGSPMSFAGTIHTTQTASSEQSEYIVATQNAGTLTEGLRVTNTQQLKLPGYTTSGLLSNDSSGNITSVTNYAVTGDIAQTSFTAADNQAAAANVTGFAFANASVRGFNAIVSVTRGTTYAIYDIKGIQKAASWEIDQSYVGDSTGLTFTITSTGQIQYTSTSIGDTATVKFRANVLSV